MTRSRARNWWLGWIAVAVILLVIALSRSSRPANDLTLQQHVLSIASQLHAPGDFNTMTAATSSLTAAQHMRYEIQQDLLNGMSRPAIMSHMVQEYGSGVLAAPNASGWGTVLWVAPVIVLIVFALGWLTVLRRTTHPQVVEATGLTTPEISSEPAVDLKAIKAKLKEYL